MRIQLSDRHLVPSLLAFLGEHVHVTANDVGPQVDDPPRRPRMCPVYKMLRNVTADPDFFPF